MYYIRLYIRRFNRTRPGPYSRDQEARADEAAITYLEKAGYSGAGIVEFFNKFRYEEVFSDIKKYPYWVDHPLSDEATE